MEQRSRHFAKTVAEICATFNTTTQHGLQDQVVQQLSQQVGLNQLSKQQGPKWYKILLHHTLAFMNFVLLFAVVISCVVQQWIDVAVIFVVIFLNIGIGFVQEFKSEKTLASLQMMTRQITRVVRNGGQVCELESQFLVPGDIVLLQQGDLVPADLRLFEIFELECNEASLTGESVPVAKTVDALADEDVALADQTNMAFMNTLVVKGKGKGIVVSTGMNTQIGAIAKSISRAKKESTELQKRLTRLGIVLVVAAIVCIGLVLIGVWAHGTAPIFPEGLTVAVSTAVAIIPEALVPVTTLTMTLGVREMAKKQAIVRKLNALESLGNVSDICSDKTGTITEGKMYLKKLYIQNREFSDQLVLDTPDLHAIVTPLLLCMTLCNSAEMTTSDAEVQFSGSPTESALLQFAHKFGIQKSSLHSYFSLVHEFPFDSTIKRMTTVYQCELDAQQYVMYSKGAPERLLPLCTMYIGEDGTAQHLDNHSAFHDAYEGMLDEGLRVLALAFKQLPQVTNFGKREELEQELVFLGFVGIQDPPRKEVIAAVEKCKKAGITVRMVTGDHIGTASAIAVQIGIITQEQRSSLVSSAVDFDALNDEQLMQRPLPVVIARCSPQTKVKLIELLHKQKKRVAMTGDGINDAPAIKTADVGIAMGIAGTDVTKQSADIILTDDSFGTIVNAIAEGRRIFSNIRKFVIHLLSGNIAETIVLVIAIISGLPPLQHPTQILWLNLVTGLPMAVGLGREKPNDDLMDLKHRPLFEPLFTWQAICDIFYYGILIGGITIANYSLLEFWLRRPQEQEFAAVFTTLTLLLLLHAYNVRSPIRPIWANQVWKSYWLHIGMIIGLVTTAIAIYVPGLNTAVLHHGSLGVEWAVIAPSIVVYQILVELYKLAKRSVFWCVHRRAASKLVHNV